MTRYLVTFRLRLRLRPEAYQQMGEENIRHYMEDHDIHQLLSDKTCYTTKTRIGAWTDSPEQAKRTPNEIYASSEEGAEEYLAKQKARWDGSPFMLEGLDISDPDTIEVEKDPDV